MIEEDKQDLKNEQEKLKQQLINEAKKKIEVSPVEYEEKLNQLRLRHRTSD